MPFKLHLGAELFVHVSLNPVASIWFGYKYDVKRGVATPYES